MKNIENYWTITIFDQDGNSHIGAYIENKHDALMVGKFYRDVLGYEGVQVWHGNKVVLSTMLDHAIEIMESEKELFGNRDPKHSISKTDKIVA